MSHTTPGHLLTVTEAAERLDTQVRFVRRLIAAGRVEPVVARRRPR
jgi:excisionase family DNA binding protein